MIRSAPLLARLALGVWVLSAGCALIGGEQRASDLDPDGDGSPWGEDCDDTDRDNFPGNEEVCDGADNDCDEAVDETAVGWYLDLDMDGYGADDSELLACERPSEAYILTPGDCDDADIDVNPEGVEVCGDGVDNDCDGDPDGCAFQGTHALNEAGAIFVGESAYDSAGRDVAGAGDVNGDGYGDVLVGAWRSGAGGVDAGAAYLIYGPVEGELSLSEADARFVGAEGDQAGHPVSGVGDVNGDGFDDVLISAFYADAGANNAGAAYLLHGPFSGELSVDDADVSLIGENEYDLARGAHTGVVDLNGDGFSDLLLSAYNHDGDGKNGAGAIYAVYGPVSGEIDLADAEGRLVGEDQGDHAGSAVASAEDTDGDGYGDVALSASSESTGGANAGAVYLMLGPVSGERSLSAADAKITGVEELDSVGAAIANSDVDGAGLGDLLIGATGAGNSGALYLFYGPVTGEFTTDDADAVFEGEVGDKAGIAVGAAGDVDRDGVGDFLVGAVNMASSQQVVGGAYLVFGEGL